MFRIGERASSSKDPRRKSRSKTPHVNAPSKWGESRRFGSDPTGERQHAEINDLCAALKESWSETTEKRRSRRRAVRSKAGQSLGSSGEFLSSWVAEEIEGMPFFTCGKETSATRRKRRPGVVKVVIPVEIDATPGSDTPAPVVQPTLDVEELKCVQKLKEMGNEAIQNGNVDSARQLYTEGIAALQGKEGPTKQLLSKLLSNRAAALLQQQNPSGALGDCREAWQVWPKNIRAYVRASTCHIALGQFRESQSVLQGAMEMLSASDSQFQTLQGKLQLTEDLKNKLEDVAMHCGRGEIDAEVLASLSCLCLHVYHFERVWRLAALTYLQSNAFEKLDGVFEEAERIFQIQGTTNGCQYCWWQWMRMEAAWWNPCQAVENLLGEMEILLESLQCHALTEMQTTPETNDLERDTLHLLIENLTAANNLKDAGNLAFNRKDYDQALELYSQAIQICEAVGSPMAFLSVLYCNRGAVLHGSGRYIEALRDVSVALALNPLYAKAYLRMGQMHLETHNLPALREVLAGSEAQSFQFSAQDAQTLQSLREKADLVRRERRLDAYKLMGLSHHCDISEVKKSFRKLALKLHPDKASHSVKLQLTWMADSPIFVLSHQKRVREELQNRMQFLFKLLNSAHVLLTDATERQKLDAELYRPYRSPRGWTHRSAPGWNTSRDYGY